MRKILHHALLVSMVLLCALVSSIMVHKLLTVSGIMARIQRGQAVLENKGATDISPIPTRVEFLAKDASGAYILPTLNPTYPLQLGPYTVGGVTACERLYNLGNCLKEKKSPLVSKLLAPEASSGAGLETVCGGILNDLAYLRPQTVEIGCVW